jgi:hypothetical protein
MLKIIVMQTEMKKGRMLITGINRIIVTIAIRVFLLHDCLLTLANRGAPQDLATPWNDGEKNQRIFGLQRICKPDIHITKPDRPAIECPRFPTPYQLVVPLFTMG